MADAMDSKPTLASHTAEHPDETRLRAFALGLLPESELLDLARHIADCESCRNYVDTAPGDALVERILQVPQAASSVPLRIQTGYEILDLVGEGGMATVYKARQAELGRIVALKRIKGNVDAQGLARFRAEASVMARLHHPNIVQVHDVGEQDGQPYIASEFVAGGTLDQRLRGNPLPYRIATRLVATLARAVHAAHEQSIIHRDLKPGNVLLDVPEPSRVDHDDEQFWELATPKISDFGLAKQLDHDEIQTHTGAILGTPGYMAPEQASSLAAEIGVQTDVYALGVILYETLTGRRPFQGSTLLETLELVRSADPVPPRRWRTQIPRDLDMICLKCLEKERRRRYSSALELAQDLERLLAGEPIHARSVGAWERLLKWSRRRPAWAALIVLVVLSLTSLMAGTVWHNRRLRAEVDRANANEAVALANFRSGHDVIQEMIDEAVDSAAETSAWRDLRDRLYRLAARYHDVALEGADETNPDVQLAKAMSLLYKGSMHMTVGEFSLALRDLEPARRQLEALLNASPQDAEIRSRLAACCRNLGAALSGQADYAGAKRQYLRAIQLRTPLLRAASADGKLEKLVAGLHESLAGIYDITSQADLAERSYRNAVKLRQQALQTREVDNVNRWHLAATWLALARHNDQAGRSADVEPCLRESESVLLAASPGPAWLMTKKFLAQGYQQWGEWELARDRLDDALRHFDLCIATWREAFALDANDELVRQSLPAAYRRKA